MPLIINKSRVLNRTMAADDLEIWFFSEEQGRTLRPETTAAITQGLKLIHISNFPVRSVKITQWDEGTDLPPRTPSHRKIRHGKISKSKFTADFLRRERSLLKTTGKRPQWFVAGGSPPPYGQNYLRYLGRTALIDLAEKRVIWMSRYIYDESDPGRQVYDGARIVPQDHKSTWETETETALPTSTTNIIQTILNDGNEVIGDMVKAANWRPGNEQRRHLLRHYLRTREYATLEADLDSTRIGPVGEKNPAGCGHRKVDAIHRTDDGVALVKVKGNLEASTLETAIGQAILNRRLYRLYNTETSESIESVVVFGSSQYDIEAGEGIGPLIASIANELDVTLYLRSDNQYQDIGEWATNEAENLLPDPIAKSPPQKVSGEQVPETPIHIGGTQWPEALKVDWMKRNDTTDKNELIEMKPRYEAGAVASAIGQILLYRAGLIYNRMQSDVESSENVEIYPVIRFGSLGTGHQVSSPWQGTFADIVDLLREIGIRIRVITGLGETRDLTSRLIREQKHSPR